MGAVPRKVIPINDLRIDIAQVINDAANSNTTLEDTINTLSAINSAADSALNKSINDLATTVGNNKTNSDTAIRAAEKSAASSQSTSKLFLVGATAQDDNLKTTYSNEKAYVGTDNHLYSNGTQVVNLSDTQALTNKTYNGYTLKDASGKDVTDSSSASAIGTGTSLPTERDIYYGLPTINNAHDYNSESTYYAPTSGGGTGDELVSDGSTNVPVWKARNFVTCNSAANAAAKVASLTNFKLAKGVEIFVNFANTNTATSSLTLNIESTGDKAIFVNGAAISASQAHLLISGVIWHFVYDGTNWELINLELNKKSLNGAIIGDSFDAAQKSAASSQSTLKLFLVGATEQNDTLKTTYSNNKAYVGTDNHLYSNGIQVVNLSDAQALTNKTYNGYTLKDAAGKDITDSSSASAIGTGTDVPTERDIYYGLPTINNSHAYTSSTKIYAPTAGGTAGYELVGNGTTAAPIWKAPNLVTCATAADAADKTADLANFKLVTGASVYVKFSTTNTATASLTLNINSTGAKSIFVNGAAISATQAPKLIAGIIWHFIYDGTNWELINLEISKMAYSGSAIANSVVKSRTDSTSAAAIGTGSSLTTERDVYYGLPKINNLHNYNSNSDYYAPITGGAEGNELVAVGATSAPVWKAPSFVTCSTAAATAAKEVALTNFKLVTGASVYVKFTNANTATASLTLNVESTGAKAIFVNGVAISATQAPLLIAGVVWHFVYDGTNWELLNLELDKKSFGGAAIGNAISSTVTDRTAATKIGTGTTLLTERAIYYGLPTINNSHAYTSSTKIYAPTAGGTAGYELVAVASTSAPVWKAPSFVTCSTAAATAAKEVALTNFKLATGVHVYVKFTNTNTATTGLTLNVESTGAKSIFVNGVVISETQAILLISGVIWHFVYDGTNWELLNLELDKKSFGGAAIGNAISSTVTDRTAATKIGTGTTLLTERAIYYGLPTINNSHAYTSSTKIYAPTAGGTAGYELVGNGTTAAPIWKAPNYVECSTAAATAAKAVSITNFKLVAGVMVAIKFTNANTANSPTLNVTETGAKSIVCSGSTLATNGLAKKFKTNYVYFFVYDGTNWVVLNLFDNKDNQVFIQSTCPTDVSGVTQADFALNNIWLDTTNMATATISS